MKIICHIRLIFAATIIFAALTIGANIFRSSENLLLQTPGYFPDTRDFCWRRARIYHGYDGVFSCGILAGTVCTAGIPLAASNHRSRSGREDRFPVITDCEEPPEHEPRPPGKRPPGRPRRQRTSLRVPVWWKRRMRTRDYPV